MIVPLIAAIAFAPSKGVLVVDCLAIGSVEGTRWRQIKDVKSDPIGKLRGLKFREFGLGTVGKTFPKNKLDYMDEAAPGWYFSGEQTANLVLWSGSQAAMPAVTMLSPQQPVYVKATQDLLLAKKLKGAKAVIQKIVSVDLDGDKVNEILIEAAPQKDMTDKTMEDAKKTDYSMVLIRFVKNGKPVTQAVEYDDAHTGSLGNACELRAIADFDGDGVFEFVTSSNYYEGTSAKVWRFKKGKLSKLVENGSGL